MKCEEIEPLLSAYLDGELIQQERQKVEIHLEECPKCRKMLHDLESVRQRARDLQIPQPDGKEWKNMESYVLERLFRGLGWVFTIAWAAGTLIYGLYEYASSPREPLLQKLALFGLLFGVLMLFLSVLIERLRELKTDRYKGVRK